MRHIEIHSAERRYECELCMKKFRRKEHLEGHKIKIHLLPSNEAKGGD